MKMNSCKDIASPTPSPLTPLLFSHIIFGVAARGAIRRHEQTHSHLISMHTPFQPIQLSRTICIYCAYKSKNFSSEKCHRRQIRRDKVLRPLILPLKTMNAASKILLAIISSGDLRVLRTYSLQIVDMQRANTKPMLATSAASARRRGAGLGTVAMMRYDTHRNYSK